MMKQWKQKSTQRIEEVLEDRMVPRAITRLRGCNGNNPQSVVYRGCLRSQCAETGEVRFDSCELKI